ncbi:MAG: Gfo/Idh/MocA family oxidoreductase [Deltaproteobacteria bacterium]|nr:Gfo/Idh/MocA family oxidoreductase [Deltaproteobacteria bacterium]
MDKVRVGIVGSQFAAHLHLNNYSKLRGSKMEILGIASRTEKNAQMAAKAFNIPSVYTDYRKLLERKDIDAIDLCIPTNLHEEMIITSAEAGKHIICEKPLTGYFGEDVEGEDIGFRVSKEVMLRSAMESCARIRKAIEKNRILFNYAEDWVYAPSVEKIKRIVRVTGGTIMDIRAEESHSGSHAAYSRKWKTSGGGALLRLGCHPIGAALHLKYFEGQLRDGKPIRPKFITAEVGQHTRIPSFQKEQKKWLVNTWEDVEDWSALIITFEDNSKASIFSSDGVLGGTRNNMQVYLSNAVAFANINPNNAVEVYAPDPKILGDEYISEKLETKAGWNFASPDEDWMRGFPQELEDFIDSIRQGKEPLSGLKLAEDTMEVVYAAYLSAEKGQRIQLNSSK